MGFHDYFLFPQPPMQNMWEFFFITFSSQAATLAPRLHNKECGSGEKKIVFHIFQPTILPYFPNNNLSKQICTHAIATICSHSVNKIEKICSVSHFPTNNLSKLFKQQSFDIFQTKKILFHIFQPTIFPYFPNNNLLTFSKLIALCQKN